MCVCVCIYTCIYKFIDVRVIKNLFEGIYILLHKHLVFKI